MAAAVRADGAVSKLPGARVYLQDFETDRAVVQVVVEHADAVGTEATSHPIRSAALAAGLRVDAEADLS